MTDKEVQSHLVDILNEGKGFKLQCSCGKLKSELIQSRVVAHKRAHQHIYDEYEAFEREL